MNAEEAEHVIAILRAENEELKSQIEALEHRAGRHDCLIDLCEFDSNMNCVLRPCDGDTCWGAEG